MDAIARVDMRKHWLWSESLSAYRLGRTEDHGMPHIRTVHRMRVLLSWNWSIRDLSPVDGRRLAEELIRAVEATEKVEAEVVRGGGRATKRPISIWPLPYLTIAEARHFGEQMLRALSADSESAA